jgi:hypothetical protein
VSSKLRTWRYLLKNKLNIQPCETPELVRARVQEDTFKEYDVEDVRVLLERWCDDAYRVGHELY